MFTRWNPFILCLIKKNTTKNFRKIENCVHKTDVEIHCGNVHFIHIAIWKIWKYENILFWQDQNISWTTLNAAAARCVCTWVTIDFQLNEQNENLVEKKREHFKRNEMKRNGNFPSMWKRECRESFNRFFSFLFFYVLYAV